MHCLIPILIAPGIAFSALISAILSHFAHFTNLAYLIAPMPLHFRGVLALLIVTMVWGTTFPAMKELTAHFSSVWIVLFRFVLAALVLSPFLLRARWQEYKIGAALGLCLFASFMFQLEGLALISANRNAFITGLNVLIVPLLGIAMGKLPERRIVLAVLLAVAGLAALCWDGGAWGRGDTFTLLSALCFGIYVKLMEQGTRKVNHLIALTATQILTVALCAALWLWLVDVPNATMAERINAQGYSAYIWQGLGLYGWNLAYLGLVATAAIISLQTWGQGHTSANEAAIIYAFEPGCAAIAAYFWVGESMTPLALFGAALLIFGMIVSQWQSTSPQASLVPE
jgi:drug/metabolite transporter (DMT)-like permease